MYKFIKLPNCFPKQLYHFFSFLLEVHKNSNFSTSLSILLFVSLYNFSLSSKCIAVSHCGFNLRVLMTSDAEHHFVCLFAICVSSLVKYLFKSVAYFFNRIFILLQFFYLQKSYKDSTKEFLYSTHLVSSTANVLCQYVSFATTKPILVCYCLRKFVLYSDFLSSHLTSFVLPGSHL